MFLVTTAGKYKLTFLLFQVLIQVLFILTFNTRSFKSMQKQTLWTQGLIQRRIRGMVSFGPVVGHSIVF